jgi:uncharacterized glyoxalase superfamily protein PhnB
MSDDAFTSLARPIVPEQPRQRFADDLRARLLRAATTEVTLTPRAPAPIPHSDERTQAVPQTITPYLCVADAPAALEWYRTYFGATVDNVIEWEGRIGHAELEFGGAEFYLSDEAPSLGVLAPTSLGAGNSSSYVVRVAAVDQFVARAVEGGAQLQRPIEEAHGTRNAWLLDPFGHRWNVGTPLVDREAAAARRGPAEPYYLTITSPDVERAAAFFGAVLDWQFAEPHNGGRHIVNTAMPMGLRPPANPFSETEPGQVDLWFTVRDFDDALERVRMAGGTVLSITSYDSGREAQCEDDQGVLFRFSEPAPGYDVG